MEKLSFHSVNNGDKLPVIELSASQENIWKHAVGSLDYNPIHTHPEWAKTAQAFGIPETIQHGNQTLSQITNVVTDWALCRGGKLNWVDIKLIKPVPVDSFCTYGGEVTEKHFVDKDQNYVVVELWTKNQDEELVGIGTAKITLPD